MKKVSGFQGKNMWILREFFEIEDEASYNRFIKSYGKTELGNLLIKNYNSAIDNISLLDILKEEEKFMYRLDQEILLEARKEALEEGRKEERLEVAKSLLNENVDINVIQKVTSLSREEIENLKQK